MSIGIFYVKATSAGKENWTCESNSDGDSSTLPCKCLSLCLNLAVRGGL